MEMYEYVAGDDPMYVNDICHETLAELDASYSYN
jgi:hypothetical protein